jgi:acyl-coenzyme A synthetase/AMP-(fatty) acid ligase
MIIYAETDEIWTFNDVNNMSNQLSHYFLHQGYVKGDAVAIFMENHPKYMVVLLALAKIGVIAALINNNLTHEVILLN